MMINEKNTSELRKFEFRAVTMRRNREDIDYSSVSIQEAEGSYDTVGLYEIVKEGGCSVSNHIADMPIEDFTAVTNFHFPVDFDSWQQTHFAMVEHLLDLCRLKPEEQPIFFRGLYARFGKPACYPIAKDWTDEFERLNKNRYWKNDFQDEVRMFVQQKIKQGQ
jgi:hypothetical protein